MFAKFLKLTYRNIIKTKVFSVINILGLAIAITGTLLILVYVSGELSYESHHENKENIVRVSVAFGTDNNAMKLAGAMPALGPAAAEEIPEVTAAVRFRIDGTAKIKSGNREFTEQNFFFADKNVFDVFSFRLISGNKKALENPSAVIISESAAKKYFGDNDPIGKSLTYNGLSDFIVSGIIENVPEATYLKCDFIAPYSSEIIKSKITLPWNQWGEDYTYLLLKENTNLPALKDKLQKMLIKNTNEQFGAMLGLYILPLSDIYLKSDMMGELGPTGNLNGIYLFSSIAVMVMIIASLNFINLSTARSLRRSKEVGIRKVLGADRKNLFYQFWGESFTITLIAVLLSIILFELFNPLLYKYFEINLQRNFLNNKYFYYILSGIILFISLFAGVYPAVFLSKYKPIESLKGKISFKASGINLRKTLVVIQFSITVFLLIGSAAIYKQLNFMRNADAGFSKENVIIINYPASDEDSHNKYYVLKDALKSITGVEAVSAAFSLPGINSKEQQSIRLKDAEDDKQIMMQAVGVDHDFVNTLGLKITEGRNFSEKFGAEDESVILNEAAVKKLGLKNSIGTGIYIPSGSGETKLVTVVGVIKDFHLRSFHTLIEPMFLYINPDRFFRIAVKYKQEYSQNIIPMIKNKWENIIPHQKFEFSSLADKYNSLYNNDEKEGTLFLIFTLLSVLIASMGLFGLTAFMTEMRTKEIGIRKLLGADVKGIVLMFSGEYSKSIAVSNIIAWPFAYFAVSKWLNEFAYKTEIGFEIFIVSALIILTVVLITVSFHVIKAASYNPVDSIRYE